MIEYAVAGEPNQGRLSRRPGAPGLPPPVCRADGPKPRPALRRRRRVNRSSVRVGGRTLGQPGVAGIVVQPLEAVLHDARRGPCESCKPCEIEKEGWARKMQRLLRRACHAANLARERGVALQPSLVEGFRDGGTPSRPRASSPRSAPHRPRARPGHNLLLRLQARKEDRYASSPTSPCPSPTIRPSRTCAWRSSSRKSPRLPDPNKGRT